MTAKPEFQHERSRVVTHLSSLISTYDVFVFPIFGILHNGEVMDEGAYNCLEKLSEHGKTVAIFSNVPKRRNTMIQELANIGIPPSLYQHVITAGEETYNFLKDRKDPLHSRFGRNCFLIGASDNIDLIEGLDLHQVKFVDEADFILVLGPDEWNDDLASYEETLEAAAKLNIPMVCANPDLYVRYQGVKSIRAGAIAQHYESLGCNVAYHGKPHPSFYQTLLDDIAPVPKEKVLILGDSILTDIHGARGAGFKSLLCMNDTSWVDVESSIENGQFDNHSLDSIQDKMFILGEVSTYLTKELQW